MVIALIKGMNVRDIVQEIKKTGQWLYPTARVSGCTLPLGSVAVPYRSGQWLCPTAWVSGCALAGNSVLGRAALAIPTLPA
jgi:hypothetical protein